MHIQWFPGHMTKSMRMIKENLPIIDAVVYVLDSRAPASCLNPEFDKLIKHKKTLYLLNKSDLAEAAATAAWKAYFTHSGAAAVAADATKSTTTKVVFGELKKLLSDKINAFAQKGVALPLKIMVLGIPNSGKSTLINTLCGGKRALTGNKPGVTRGKQWIRAGGFEILDTPGTLWNAFADQKSARRLAYIGSINDDILDTEQLALCFLEDADQHKDKVLRRYNIEENCWANSAELLQHIGKKRGFLLKGEVDIQRTAEAVIDDFRKGRMGRITLELPQKP